MLRLEVVISEGYDEETSEFTKAESVIIELEHSLVSLSKWESQWCIPFLSNEEKTEEQVLSYVLCMILPGGYPESALHKLNQRHFEQVNEYINSKMTATWVHEDNPVGPHEIITAELIYYWMIALGIPVQFENWHLNRLLMLIKVCSIKNNAGKKKIRPGNSAAERRALNEQRRRELGTRG